MSGSEPPSTASAGPEGSVPSGPVTESSAPGGESAGPAATGVRRRRPVWTLLRLLLGAALQLVLLLLVLLGLVLGTQTGLRSAFAIAEELAPGLIRVGQAEGRLLGRLHLTDLEVHLGEVDLMVGSLDLHWTPLAALAGRLPISALRVQDIDLSLPPGEDKAREPIVLPEVVLPLELEIGELLVERLRVFERDAEAPLVVLDRGVLAARLRGNELVLQHLEVELSRPSLSAQAQGQAELRDLYPLGLDLRWDLALPPAARLLGQGRVAGDLGRLSLVHRVSGSARLTLDAWVQNLLGEPAWEGLIQLEGLDLPDFAAAAPPLELTARLETRGDLATASLTGTLDGKAPDRPEFGQLQASLDLQWRDRVLEARALDLRESVSGARLGATGRLDLRQDPGSFEVKGGWERLRWPLSGDLLAESSGGSLEAAGTFDAYSYKLSGSAQGPGVPALDLRLVGTGDRRGTEIQPLGLDLLQGRIEGQGRADWDPKVGWDGSLTWSGIDPSALAPAWPGRLEGRIASQGTLEEDGPRLSVRIDDLRGELRGFPVAATGRLEMEGGSLRVQGIEASSGPTHLRVDGAAGQDRLDLAFDLSSPDLGTLMPDAKGSVAVSGRLGGGLQAPQLKLDLAAKGTELAGQGIGSLNGTVDLVLAPDGRFDIRLDGRDLVAGGLRFDTLEVRGDGGMPDHRLSLAVTGQPLAARLEANGSMAQDRSYQGTLSRLDLETGPWGSWRLQRSAPVRLAGPRIGAGPLCLRNGQGSGGCLGFDQEQPGRWSADLDLDRLGVELVQGLLPRNLAAEGEARVRGRFRAEGSVLTGSAVAEIPQGQVRVVSGSGAGEVLDFSSARLSLDSGSSGISTRLDLPFQGLGNLAGNLDLPGWRLDQAARPDQPLRGALRGRIDGLSRVSNLVPDLTGVTGSLDADLTLGGTLAAPEVRGQASARGLGGEVPLIGLKLADLSINLVATPERVDIQGQGDLGGGRLELIGDYRTDKGFPGEGRARILGERLKVADTREYLAVVSPNFDVELDAQGLRVRGVVKVPQARIRPRSLPAGTVSASPDVVMLDQAGESKGPAFPVDLDVRLQLGDDVTINAFGVRGRLTGDLRVFQEPGRQILGDGQLAIVDGLYRLSGGFGLAAEVGAPLTIEQGRLVFAKSPIDNPGLLLQAQREGGDTTAGVRVLGTLRNPKLAFFSESDPDMTQAEITKYLLTGIPPRRDNGSEDRSLSLGTYVAPKLYVEYESGLSDQKDKVKLRYDLNRRIELQTETGEGQGGDIFFKFER